MSSPTLFKAVHKPRTVGFGSLYLAGKLALLPLVRTSRRRLTGTTFVAVTGSWAKSTTVRLIAAALAELGPVSPLAEEGRSQGLKVTKAILGTRRRHGSCVYELAAYGPGTLDEILWAFEPEVGVVTGIGFDHANVFEDREAIAGEKTKLVAALPPGGVAVLNADDPRVLAMAAATTARVVLYGLSTEAEVRAEEVSAHFPERLSFVAVAGGRRVPVQTRLCGRLWLTAALAALATAKALGVPLEAAAERLAMVEPSHRKLSVLETPSGAIFLRDDYKATWGTVPPALEVLGSAQAGRRVAVLGYLHNYSPEPVEVVYEELAREARRNADLVLMVGPNAKYGLRARSSDGDDTIHAFSTTAEVTVFLRELLAPGDLVLVEASQLGHGLERVSLAQVMPVACWVPFCKRNLLKSCDSCRRLTRGSRRSAPRRS
jgi:UDP-N-acetylmuramoyl-tripeptide--D-alanyl-D-alanine ligase